MNEQYRQPDPTEEGSQLNSEELDMVERIIKLLCFISFSFLILFIYLSIPTLKVIFSGSGDVFLFINIIIPLIHQALATWLLWNKAPLGWYLFYTYLVTSSLFSLIGLASSLSFNITGEYLMNYMTAVPFMYFIIYLSIYVVVAVFLFRKNLRWYLYVENQGIRKWTLIGIGLFIIYLLPYFLH